METDCTHICPNTNLHFAPLVNIVWRPAITFLVVLVMFSSSEPDLAAPFFFVAVCRRGSGQDETHYNSVFVLHSHSRGSFSLNQQHTFPFLPAVLFIHLDCFSESCWIYQILTVKMFSPKDRRGTARSGDDAELLRSDQHFKHSNRKH